MIQELKQKLSELMTKRDEPEKVQRDILLTQQAIKSEERKVAKELEDKAQAERQTLKAEKVFEVLLVAKCPKCKGNVEMSVAQETIRDSARQVVLDGSCQSPRCATTPEFQSNDDLNKTLLFCILPLQASGRWKQVMQR
jgi:hypothetical protein